MIIHFVCRGNAFRSIIAEAYLNSLEIKGWSTLSSGTAAASDRAKNLHHYQRTLDLLEEHGIREFAKGNHGEQLTQERMESADINVCMNQRVYDECLERATFPARPRIWSVADIGEPGRVPATDAERERFREEAYQEIVKNVDQLISDVHGLALPHAAVQQALRRWPYCCGNAGSLSSLGRRRRWFLGSLAAAWAMAVATSVSHNAFSACRKARPNVARTPSHDMPRNPAPETATAATLLVPPGA